jgi:hypothetical protein
VTTLRPNELAKRRCSRSATPTILAASGTFSPTGEKERMAWRRLNFVCEHRSPRPSAPERGEGSLDRPTPCQDLVHGVEVPVVPVLHESAGVRQHPERPFKMKAPFTISFAACGSTTATGNREKLSADKKTRAKSNTLYPSCREPLVGRKMGSDGIDLDSLTRAPLCSLSGREFTSGREDSPRNIVTPWSTQ